MYYSLNQTLRNLDDATVVYPGHAYAPESSTTIGAQKRSNIYMRFGSVDEFLRAMGYARDSHPRGNAQTDWRIDENNLPGTDPGGGYRDRLGDPLLLGSRGFRPRRPAQRRRHGARARRERRLAVSSAGRCRPMFCPQCGLANRYDARFCSSCSAPMPDEPRAIRHSPGVAAVLSFFWCGLGQIYNGQIGKGLLMMGVYALHGGRCG